MKLRFIAFCALALSVFADLQAQPCKPKINWSDTVSFCQGNTFTLNAFNTNSTYIWNTGAVSSSITVGASGYFWVKVTNSCGFVSDTIYVNVETPVFPNLGPDRKMCSTSGNQLSAPFAATATYLWNTSATSRSISVTQSGIYWVDVTNHCGTFRDSVVITLQNPANVNLGPDQFNCNNSVKTLSIPTSTDGTILWSTGASSTSISTTQTGVFWVQVQSSCGTFSDTAQIYKNPGLIFNLPDTVGKCPTTPVTLSSNVGGGSYLWSTNATSPSISVNSTGLYWLDFITPCGTFRDTVYVVNTGPPIVDLGPDTTICSNFILTLDAQNPGSNYSWSVGGTGQKIWVDTSGTYWVGVNNGCGLVYDTITVNVVQIPKLSIDTVAFCPGSTVDVNAGSWPPNATYLWSNGETDSIATYGQQGAAWVQVTNDCGAVTENFFVFKETLTAIDLGPDTVVCGFDLILDPPGLAFKNARKILWSNGWKDTSTNVNTTGIYHIEVTTACGILRDTIEVTFVRPPQPLSDTVIKCINAPLVLSQALMPETSYWWSTGDTTHHTTVTQTGLYFYSAANICDSIYDTVNVKQVKPVNVNLGNDTTFCEPDFLLLGGGFVNSDSILWSTGSRNGQLPVFTSGTYWVSVHNACGSFSDTINVTVDLLPNRVLQNQEICSGDSIYINAQQALANDYRWENGDTTAGIFVKTQGWHSVAISNHCGTVRDSAFVRVDQTIPPFDLGNDTIFCAGTLTLDPGAYGGADYRWQNGSRFQTLTVNQSGKYFVTATNACNSVSDTINVLITGPPKIVLGKEVRFCNGSTFTLNAQNLGSTYLWNTGETSQKINVDTAGRFYVTISNPCGTKIDSVEVIVEFPIDLDFGNDTIICQGQQLILDTEAPGSQITWSDGSSGQTLTVTQTGDYWVDVKNSCGRYKDSIFVEVQQIPVFSLGPDTEICEIDGTLEMEGPEEMQSYLWSNGATTRKTILTTSGDHWLEVENHCFPYRDSIYLTGEYPIGLDLGPDTVLCFGESLHADLQNVQYPIQWENGRTGSQREITRSGTYWAMAQNSCGVFVDTVSVSFDYPLQPGLVDTLMCRGDSAIFNLENQNYQVRWFDGSRETTRTFADEGIYPATISNRCGDFDKDFEVVFQECDCPLFLADAFTPNGDGLNDSYKAGHSCLLTEYHLRIFNRWGEVVFETKNAETPWRGFSPNGQTQPIGVYHYTLEYSWEVYGLDRTGRKQGMVSILR